MQSKIRGLLMKDIFNSLYGNNGCTVIKMAQPVNKNTPKSIQNLGFVYYEKDKTKTYNAAIKSFKEMSAIDYEYSRLGIYCAAEHMLESLGDLKMGFGQLVDFKTANDVFVSLFATMEEYFEDVSKIKPKKINKKLVKAEVEAATSFIEGVLFLKKVAKKDNSLIPLISKYERIQQAVLDQVHSHQKVIKEAKPEYVVIENETMFKDAQVELDISMKFKYDTITFENFNNIMLEVGGKREYWHAMQNQEKWDKLYEDNSRQALGKDTLKELRALLPVVFEQYKTLHHLSFTNMFKVLVVASTYYASRIGAFNEKLPKNEIEYNEHEIERLEEIERNKKEHIHNSPPEKTQKPEITIKNLEFASQILSASMTVGSLIDEVCGFTDGNQICLSLEDFNETYNIVKMSNSDLAILLTKGQDRIHGDLVDLNDLEISDITASIGKKSKGTSFVGMTHFLREIKEPFVQEYFFGKQEAVLSFVDKRS